MSARQPERPRRPASTELLVFLGPSLPAAVARRLAPCRVLPPARAGDLFAALPSRPLAVALVDGLFEAVPSVWHHEVLAAQAAGVQVFGGASMGALRAAELSTHGVVGVGRIFGWYRDGVVDDDGEVALLHAGRAHGFRPLTVPLVDVRGAAEAAVAAGACTPAAARALVRAAAGLFYQGRTWPAVLQAARLSRGARARLEAFLPTAPSLKAADARATIEAAAAYVRARRAGAPPPPPPSLPPLPSHARRQRLRAARALDPGGRAMPAALILKALRARPDADRLAAQGLRRALLAALARSLGVAVDEAARQAAERGWLEALGVGPGNRDAFLAACALDEGAARTLAEDLALEAALLAASDRVLPDGPAWMEGLALGARLTGAWDEALAALVRRPRQDTSLAPAKRRRGPGRGGSR